MKTRKLSAQEANRLAVQLQVLRVKVIEFSLKYSFDGKSHLWGNTIDQSTLAREQAKLVELYRIKNIYETAKYRELPYIPGHGGTTEKIKEHYVIADGTIGFVEIKENSHGKSVINYLIKPRTVKRRIKQILKRKTKQNAKNKKGGQKTTSRKR